MSKFNLLNMNGRLFGDYIVRIAFKIFIFIKYLTNMNLPKIKYAVSIQWSFFIACLFTVVGANAQEIKNDTIYVNSISTTTIQFPSVIDSFRTIPVYSGYNLKKDKNSISIQANKHKPAKADMAIYEGGREHHFLLHWSNKALGTQMNFDYSTIDKLKDHMWDLKLMKEENGHPVKKNNFPKTRNDIKYDSLITSADNALNEKALYLALRIYSEAALLKPTENYPNARIKIIRYEIDYLKKQEEEDLLVKRIDNLNLLRYYIICPT